MADRRVTQLEGGTMPRNRFALAFAVALAAVAPLPAAAATIPTTGDALRVGLPCAAAPCTTTYPAGEPFFVRHGFVNEPVDVLVDPTTRYDLWVDGVYVPSATQLDIVGDETAKLDVRNFRFGMTGTHVFVGCWYAADVLVACARNTVTFVP
jgi:hypothetical protein